jgi:hypothetical protein
MLSSDRTSLPTKLQTEHERIAGTSRILSDEGEHQTNTLIKTDAQRNVLEKDVALNTETLENAPAHQSPCRITVVPHKQLPFEIMGHIFSYCTENSSR